MFPVRGKEKTFSSSSNTVDVFMGICDELPRSVFDDLALGAVAIDRVLEGSVPWDEKRIWWKDMSFFVVVTLGLTFLAFSLLYAVDKSIHRAGKEKLFAIADNDYKAAKVELVVTCR
jgi:hypothetical protein